MRSLLALFLCPICFLGSLEAGFEEVGAGARAQGMAEAFVAVADDANAIYYNPAGSTQVNESELTTQYGQFLKGLSDASAVESNYVGVLQPLGAGRWGTLGLALHNYKGSRYFADRMLYLSYARKLAPPAFGRTGPLSWGINLKQFRRQYEPDPYTNNALNDVGVGTGQADPLFSKNGYSKEAYALDLGALVQFGTGKKTSVGVSIANINQPDISLGGGKDKAPVIARLGWATRPRWGLVAVEARHTSHFLGEPDRDTAVGVERKISLGEIGAFGIRGGYAQGSRDLKTLTSGFSFYFSLIRLDYAFLFPIGNLSTTQGSHLAALSFHWGAAEAPSVRAEGGKQVASVARRGEFPRNDTEGAKEAYTAALNDYDARKSAGASVYERLGLIQEMYKRFGHEGINLSRLAQELSSL
ncbi:MAG: hypothetical protein LHV69_06215 [Elusimicrobia bacterium]|nr:hypothetical protein [Candidatus Obscuribacterium magneticum]